MNVEKDLKLHFGYKKLTFLNESVSVVSNKQYCAGYSSNFSSPKFCVESYAGMLGRICGEAGYATNGKGWSLQPVNKPVLPI